MVNPAGREEVVTLDIVRPAIPASVVALVTRRESPDRPSQIGEAIVDQIPGGLTVMSTVALATAPGRGRPAQPAGACADTLFPCALQGRAASPEARTRRRSDVAAPRGSGSIRQTCPRREPDDRRRPGARAGETPEPEGTTEPKSSRSVAQDLFRPATGAAGRARFRSARHARGRIVEPAPRRVEGVADRGQQILIRVR